MEFGMARKFATEVAAIESLRKTYATRPALALAKQIYARTFAVPSERDLATTGAGYNRYGPDIRTVYSIYSVIRRYDAKLAIAAVVDAVAHPHSVGSLA
jgi:hypothetical protein